MIWAMPMPPAHATHGPDGKFRGTRGLTDMQAAFVHHVVAYGMGQKDAAEAAGYGTPSVDGWRLMQNSSVLDAIHDAQRRELATLASAGIRRLRAILEDDTAPTKAHLDAAKIVLDRAGHHSGAAPSGGAGQGQKPISDMSESELEAFIEAGRRMLEEAKRPTLDLTDATPPSTPDHTGEDPEGAEKQP